MPLSLPYKLRLRPDLVIQPQDSLRDSWVVKDPISLRFFLFGSDEHFILQRLDGTNTPDEIIEDFERQRAPRRMTGDRLHAFLSALHRNGLACSDAPGQSDLLTDRGKQQESQEMLLGWSNLLAIRFPGINPDALLERLYPAVKWCFSWQCMAMCMMIVAAAVAVIIAEFDVMKAQWPHLSDFLSSQNLIWFVAALCGAKVLHELGHAFTCKHFGGQCHELGVMLLVFTPCLYCNVTDAWMLRSRWQRMAISAAGIVVEVVLASLAVILWRYTQPGVLNSICMNLMIVCSVGTVLFNGNPLLRYDGYYILSDALGIPNLWQQSRDYFYGRLSEIFLRGSTPVGTMDHQRPRVLATYAIASIAYRCFLTLAIFLFLYRVLHPLGLDAALLLIVVVVVGNMTVGSASKASRWFADPRQAGRIRKIRLVMLLTFIGACLALGVLAPLPCTVTAPSLLQPSGAKYAYIATPGILRHAVRDGDYVEADQTLATLENPDLADQLAGLQGDLRRAQARVDALQVRQGGDADVAAKLLVAEEILADFRQQVQLKQLELSSLTIASPVDGIVIAPPRVPPSADRSKELPTWDGSPLDGANRGSFLERGTLLCLIGDPDHCDVVVYVDENDVRYIRQGQPARVRLEHAPADVLVGKVVEISEITAETAPAELAAARDLTVRTRRGDDLAPVRNAFQVRLAVESSKVPRLVGARGTAKIEVEPQTIAERVARWLKRTLALEPASSNL